MKCIHIFQGNEVHPHIANNTKFFFIFQGNHKLILFILYFHHANINCSHIFRMYWCN